MASRSAHHVRRQGRCPRGGVGRDAARLTAMGWWPCLAKWLRDCRWPGRRSAKRAACRWSARRRPIRRSPRSATRFSASVSSIRSKDGCAQVRPGEATSSRRRKRRYCTTRRRPIRWGCRKSLRKRLWRWAARSSPTRLTRTATRNFAASLTTIRSSNPDVVFIPGYYTEVGNIALQARKLGITVPLLGGDGWDSSKLGEIGGEAIKGCFYSNHYSHEDPNPKCRISSRSTKPNSVKPPTAWRLWVTMRRGFCAEAIEPRRSRRRRARSPPNSPPPRNSTA